MSSWKIDPKLVRQRIRYWREQRGLTQDEVATQAELGEKYYQNLEAGRTANPTLDTLNRLAVVFDVPVWALLYTPTHLKESLKTHRE